LAEIGFRIDDTTFETDVCIKGTLLKSDLEKLEKQITEITSGKTSVSVISEKFDY
jgi:hypothetical protein